MRRVVMRKTLLKALKIRRVAFLPALKLVGANIFPPLKQKLLNSFVMQRAKLQQLPMRRLLKQIL